MKKQIGLIICLVIFLMCNQVLAKQKDNDENSSNEVKEIIKTVEKVGKEINYRVYKFEKVNQRQDLTDKPSKQESLYYGMFDNLIERKSCLDDEGVINIEIFSYPNKKMVLDEANRVRVEALKNLCTNIIKSNSSVCYIRNVRGLLVTIQKRNNLILISESTGNQDNEIDFIVQRIIELNSAIN